MLFTGNNYKIHIFKYPSHYTYCGCHSVYIGSIGHWAVYPTPKMIRRYRGIICKKCLKYGKKGNISQ